MLAIRKGENIMKREEFEKFLGMRVRIVFINDVYQDECIGVLEKTGTEKWKNNFNLYIPKNYYFLTQNNQCISSLFRVSHVKKCTLV